MDKALLVAALAALVMPACRASVNVNAKASSEESEPEPEMTAESAPVQPSAPIVVDTAYFGVARSLTLRPSEGAATCSCVKAKVGSAASPAFDWHGAAPAVASDAMVVAVSAEGVDCPAKGRGPSIAAIDRVGNDVVVVLEEFKETRPLALGAIIPNPGPGGRIFLRARGKSPYGRPLDASTSNGRNWCLVGQGVESQQLLSPDSEDE